MQQRNRYLSAAVEINDLWRRCLKMRVESCPSNEEVAEIIEKHMKTKKQSKAPKKNKESRA